MPNVSVNGVNLHYEDLGRGTPLVLIHHLGGNLLSWRHQIIEFTKSFRVIAYELRGHGNSAAPPSGYGIENQTKDLQSLLDTLGVPSCHVLGHSIGGLIALRLALNQPDCVEKLVLVDTRCDPFTEEGRKRYHQMSDIARTQGMEAVAEHRRATDEFVKKLAKDPKIWQDFKRMYMETSVIGFVKCVEALSNVPSMCNELDKINIPTLFLVGSDDTLSRPYLEIMAKKMPKFTSFVFEHCGHFPMAEAPAEFNRHVLSFLRDL